MENSSGQCKVQSESLQCPIGEVLTLASAKWTVEIFAELVNQPTRTRQFLHHIPGLSMKCLRQRLQQLQDHGLINRKQFDQRALRVEYSITEKGRRFLDLLNLAKQITEEWNNKTFAVEMQLPEAPDTISRSCDRLDAAAVLPPIQSPEGQECICT
jgi:DNA-binding HxlR family transcriptional regulator